jgi:hypothetical protein
MIESPCLFICTLEDGVCIGCHRTKEEISNWTTYTDSEKQMVLDRLKKKKRKNAKH